MMLTILPICAIALCFGFILGSVFIAKRRRIASEQEFKEYQNNLMVKHIERGNP